MEPKLTQNSPLLATLNTLSCLKDLMVTNSEDWDYKQAPCSPPTPSAHGHLEEGGGFWNGLFCMRKSRCGFISHAIPTLLWEISHPPAVSLPFARLDLPCYSVFMAYFSLFFARNVVFFLNAILAFFLSGGLLLIATRYKVLTDGQLFSPYFSTHFLVTTHQIRFGSLLPLIVIPISLCLVRIWSPMCFRACSSSGFQVVNHCRNLLLAERKLHSVCRKWTAVQQRDESTSRGFIPLVFYCTPSTNAECVAKATVGQAILLNFDGSLFHKAA